MKRHPKKLNLLQSSGLLKKNDPFVVFGKQTTSTETIASFNSEKEAEEEEEEEEEEAEDINHYTNS